MGRTNTRKKRQSQKARRLRKVSTKAMRFQPDLYPEVNSSGIYNLDALLQAPLQPRASANPTASRRRVPKSQRMNNEQRRLTAAERLAAETARLVGTTGAFGRGQRSRRAQQNAEMIGSTGNPRAAKRTAARHRSARKNAVAANAAAANAAAHAEAQETAVQSPFFPVPGYNPAAYHELIGYPALQRAEAEQGRRLLLSLERNERNEGTRRFTPQEVEKMELYDYPKWLREKRENKSGGRRTRRRSRG